MKPTKGTKFPRTVRKGSVSVKIYRVKRKTAKSGYVYSVVWYNAKGLRDQRQYADQVEALRQAEMKAKELVATKQDAELIRWRHKEAYVKAQEIVGDTPLITVAKEWKRAFDLTGGNIVPAAQAWKNQHGSIEEVYTVGEIVKRFLKAKAEARINIKASYLRTLPAFQKVFGKKFITTITARSLQKWLNDTHHHPVTRNTHRKRIVTLWTWARKQGYLPRNVQHEAELTERAKEEAPEIGIIDAVTYSSLLELIRQRHPHYLAALVLAGFCGMRRVEVHGQLWSDISLDRKILRVSTAKDGTPQKRLVTLCDQAIEWLLLCSDRKGEVCSGTTMVLDRIRFIGKKNGLELLANCFRHSYISCRVAATGEIDWTALEAGTSAKMIHKHYRELVTEEEGKAWFSIRPNDEKKKGGKL